MGAATITLRLDDLLVGIAGDTVDTLERCRAAFAPWVDDAHRDIPQAFDLRLAGNDGGAVRSVPQLRLGGSVVARSRSADDVVAALDSILGGVRARRAQPDRTWMFLRAFIRGDRTVLVDARAPMLVNDPLLARAGIVEIPAFAVAVSELEAGKRAVVDVPAALTGTRAGDRFELVGLVAAGEAADSFEAGGASVVLARYGARHTSPTWFRTVGALLDDDRFLTAADQVTARRAIGALLDDRALSG